jgi:geranylgeranyl transferase type-2 subunit beta
MASAMPPFVSAKHKAFVVALQKSSGKPSMMSIYTEHMRLNGVYWGVSAMALLDDVAAMDVESLARWVRACGHASGGYGGNVGHDAHVQYTLSAVQVSSTHTHTHAGCGLRCANFR